MQILIWHKHESAGNAGIKPEIKESIVQRLNYESNQIKLHHAKPSYMIENHINENW